MNFYESISANYHHIFPLNKTQRSFVRQAFVETEKLNLLDIGCGIGEISLELSKYFDSVHAIDLDESMISRAKQEFSKITPNLHFSVLNMLEIEKTYGAQSFDAIVSFGNTLVHLNGPEQMLGFFSQAKNMLKKNGKFLFQIINYDRIIDQDIKALPTIENEDIRFVRNYRLHLDQKKIDFQTSLTINKSGRTIENTIELYPVRSSAINQLLQEAGFTKIYFFGNFKRGAFSEDSIPLVVEAS